MCICVYVYLHTQRRMHPQIALESRDFWASFPRHVKVSGMQMFGVKGWSSRLV